QRMGIVIDAAHSGQGNGQGVKKLFPTGHRSASVSFLTIVRLVLPGLIDGKDFRVEWVALGIAPKNIIDSGVVVLGGQKQRTAHGAIVGEPSCIVVADLPGVNT